MKSLKLLLVTAGIAALAACSGGDTNMTNVEINAADDNLALPPADTNVDVNVGTNLDTNATDNNMADNSANNTVNAY